MLKECGKELIEKVSIDIVLEDEVDNFLEEKDFFQFNLIKIIIVVCSFSFFLMIFALGVVVNLVSILVVGQFFRGFVDFNIVVIQ